MSAVDSRFVTRASRDLVRHLRRRMERTYGLGLTGLIHPVTKEFNHTAVIEQRGGRHANQVIGNVKDLGIHHVAGAIHGLYVQDAHQLWRDIADRTLDEYDVWSFFYGWIVIMQEGFKGDGASNCFYAAFSTIQQLDFLYQELLAIWDTWNIFNLLVYTPTHAFGNYSATYE